MYQFFQNEFALIKETVNHFPSSLIEEKDKRIEDLKKELLNKDSTIINLASAIEGLNKNVSQLTERTREQNIIIQSLQEKFTHQIATPKSISANNGAAPKLFLVDKILIGVAILASVAILSFLGMMLLAYLRS
jgi:methylthioribose-1-phosphate isomerase